MRMLLYWKLQLIVALSVFTTMIKRSLRHCDSSRTSVELLFQLVVVTRRYIQRYGRSQIDYYICIG